MIKYQLLGIPPGGCKVIFAMEYRVRTTQRMPSEAERMTCEFALKTCICFASS